MQNVEAAVGENDRFACSSELGQRFCQDERRLEFG
jgi:hypothetical protein